jgi:glycerophosphoryl diester phosphodiesterase
MPPRLKWHQLRRQRSDAPHLRANLEAGLRAGAALEVDLVATRDGHLLCLHDLTLDRETTGQGAVAAASRAAIEDLRQRVPGGEALAAPPLFLDELAAGVRAHGQLPPGTIQLDIKEPAPGLTEAALDRFARILDGIAPAFIASADNWDSVERLARAAPGLQRGFDPLAMYGEEPPTDAAALRSIAERTLAEAPDASVYYLEADLILAGHAAGVDLVGIVCADGALVDAWTIDAGRPGLRNLLRTLIGLGCGQITTNDPVVLAPIVAELAECS